MRESALASVDRAVQADGQADEPQHVKVVNLSNIKEGQVDRMINESFKVNNLMNGLNPGAKVVAVESQDPDPGAKPSFAPTPPGRSEQRDPRSAVVPDAYNP